MARTSNPWVWIVASLILGMLANVALAAGNGGRGAGRSGSGGSGGKSGGAGQNRAPQFSSRGSNNSGPNVTTRKLNLGNTQLGTNLSKTNGIVSQVHLPTLNGSNGTSGVAPIKPIKNFIPPITPPVVSHVPSIPTVPTHHGHSGHHGQPGHSGHHGNYGHHGFHGHFFFPPFAVGFPGAFGGYGFSPTFVGGASSTVVIERQTVVEASGAEGEKSAPERRSVRAGERLDLKGTDLGEKPGQVVLQLDKISLPVAVSEWRDDGMKVTLPSLGLGGPVAGDLFLVNAQGQVKDRIPVEVQPAAAPAADASP